MICVNIACGHLQHLLASHAADEGGRAEQPSSAGADEVVDVAYQERQRDLLKQLFRCARGGVGCVVGASVLVGGGSNGSRALLRAVFMPFAYVCV